MNHYKNIFLVSFGNIFSAAVTVFSMLAAAKFFSVEDYGVFSTSINVGNIVAGLLSFGMPAFLLKSHFLKNFNYKKNLSSFFVFYITFSLFLFFSLAMFSFYKKNNILFAICTGVYIYGQSVLEFFMLKSQIQGRYLEVFLANIFNSLFKLMLVIFYFYVINGSNLSYFSFFYILPGFFLFIYFVKCNSGVIFFKRPSLEGVLRCVKGSFPFALDSASYLLIYNSIFFFVFYFLDGEIIGNFAFSFTMINIFYFLPGLIINKIMMPRVYRLYHDDKILLLIFIKSTFKLILIFSVLSFCLIYFFASEFIELFFENKYSNAVYFLKIMSFGIFFRLCSSFLGCLLNNDFFIYYKVKVNIISAFLVVFSNIFLMSLFLESGVAFAFLFSEIIVFLLYFKIFLKNFLPEVKKNGADSNPKGVVA